MLLLIIILLIAILTVQLLSIYLEYRKDKFIQIEVKGDSVSRVLDRPTILDTKNYYSKANN